MTKTEIDRIKALQQRLEGAEPSEADNLRAMLAGASYRLVDEVEHLRARLSDRGWLSG